MSHEFKYECWIIRIDESGNKTMRRCKHCPWIEDLSTGKNDWVEYPSGGKSKKQKPKGQERLF